MTSISDRIVRLLQIHEIVDFESEQLKDGKSFEDFEVKLESLDDARDWVSKEWQYLYQNKPQTLEALQDFKSSAYERHCGYIQELLESEE